MMKHLFFTLVLFISTMCSATTIKFQTVANINGKMDFHSEGQYKWTEWKSDSTSITFKDSVIYVNNKKFSVIETPKKWHVLKDRRYVDYTCADESLVKTHIRIVEYDNNKHYNIKVLGEKEGQMFKCRYMGD